MRGRNARGGGWDDEERYGDDAGYDESGGYDNGGYDNGGYGDASYDNGGDWYAEDEERGLVLQQDQSLVGVSNTVTQHGVPLLSYTRTMNRFYSSRRQRLSLGRFKCEVCGGRIRFWAWQTDSGTRTHDGCYERLAWTWTNLYAHQQRLASQGNLE